MWANNANYKDSDKNDEEKCVLLSNSKWYNGLIVEMISSEHGKSYSTNFVCFCLP